MSLHLRDLNPLLSGTAGAYVGIIDRAYAGNCGSLRLSEQLAFWML